MAVVDLHRPAPTNTDEHRRTRANTGEIVDRRRRVGYPARHIMPCLMGCLALSLPRLVLALVWLFSDYLGRAIHSNLLLLLGFFFLPTTTLVYAWAKNSSGSVEGLYLVAMIVAVLVDLGIIGAGRGRWRKRGDGPGGGARDITITGRRVS